MGTLFSIEQILAAEADAIHGPPARDLVANLQRHLTEQDAVSERSDKDADVRSGNDEDRQAVENRKDFYCTLNNLKRSALCLSGGGIRSATFCFGVIQALAMHRLDKTPHPPRPISDLTPDEVIDYANNSLLSRFHYLSTVSGGGYIGSWLSAWRQRDDFPTVWKNLTGRPDGPDVEPPEISWLRAYSNYLTPKVGLGSADTWTGAAIFLRNLILNWLVIVPAVAVVLLVLKVIATVSVAVARWEDVWWPHFIIAGVGVAFLIVAQAFTTAHRPTRRELPHTAAAAQVGNIDQSTFLRGDLLWSVLSAILLTSFLTSHVGAQLAGHLTTFKGDRRRRRFRRSDLCRRLAVRLAAELEMPGLGQLGRFRLGLWRIARPRRASLHAAASLYGRRQCRRCADLDHPDPGDPRRSLGSGFATVRRNDFCRAGQLRSQFRRRPRMARPRRRLDCRRRHPLGAHRVPLDGRRALPDPGCLG